MPDREEDPEVHDAVPPSSDGSEFDEQTDVIDDDEDLAQDVRSIRLTMARFNPAETMSQ